MPKKMPPPMMAKKGAKMPPKGGKMPPFMAKKMAGKGK